MNVLVAIFSILGLVYASCAGEAAAIYDITASNEAAKRIGQLMIPFLFQNGFEKCMTKGHSGSLDNGNWYFKVFDSSVDTTLDRCSKLSIQQTIHVYTPEAAANRIMGSCSNNCYPIYEITHSAKYENVLKSFNDRSNCKLHVFNLKKGKIEVS
jgi:hypothetical protein